MKYKNTPVGVEAAVGKKPSLLVEDISQELDYDDVDSGESEDGDDYDEEEESKEADDNGQGGGEEKEQVEEEEDDDTFDFDYEGSKQGESSEVDSVEDKTSLKRKSLEEGAMSEKKKRKFEDARLYRQPTVKELNQLRETENLFHSNLFRLQIQEMLKEVQIRAAYKLLFNQWLEDFKGILNNLNESLDNDLMDDKWLKKLKVKLPIPKFPSTPGVFNFVKPTSVDVIGSYRMGCCLGPNTRIDIKLQMPPICFDEKDYLNHRYHRKRALYLAYMAAKLKKSTLVEEIHLVQSYGNCLKPVLEVKPAGKLGKRMLIVIYLEPPASILKLPRLCPERNNARPNWFFKESVAVAEGELSATPHYSSSILKDLVMDSNEQYRARILDEHPNLREGIVLLKIWLKQRELDQGYGCFSGYIMSMFVLYLLQKRLINGNMSCYQVARNTWNAIAKSNWTTDGITLAQSASQQSSVSNFHQYFDVVFLDVTGCYNLCADMCRETYLWVKRESELAMNCLDNPNINSFQALFMTRMPFYRQFDHIIRLEDKDIIKKLVEEHSDRSQKLDYLGHEFPQALNLILKLLRRGLHQRVFTIGVKLPSICRWSVNEPIPTAEEPIILGFTLNSEFAFSVLEKGPGANLPEALEFREFWGTKSEIRRFQDGSICEAVVWNTGTATLQEKRLICRQIVSYLLEEKLGIPTKSGLLYVADQLEALLERHSIQPADFNYGTGEEASVRVISVLDALSNQLRQIQDIPLEVSAVQGISPVFRYCEVFPSLATLPKVQKRPESRENCHILKIESSTAIAPRWVPLNEAIVQLGISGKWPQNLAAIQRIKAAFYIQIAQGLSKQFQLTVQPYPTCVHILKDGFVFSLEVAHQREISLLKAYKTAEGMTKYKDTQESIALEKKILHLPKLSSALHGLHQQFAAYGPTCCLAKRWLSSQLLDPYHFPEICIELLVASLFLTPEPYHPPNQPQLGFFRFLHLVGHTNWNTEPLILNVNGEMNREEILEIENWFHSNRTTLPALFLSTPYDKKYSVWSKEAPTLQILIRVAMLARESLRVVERILFSFHEDWKQIFRPPLDAYDVIIRLLPKLNPFRHEAVDVVTGKKNQQLPAYRQQPGEKIPVVAFNAVSCYLQELRENYGDHALFFHDVYGGDIITVLWKPPALLPKQFKVSHVNCHKPSQDGSMITLNVDAIVEDFYTLGLGIVQSVDVKSAESSV